MNPSQARKRQTVIASATVSHLLAWATFLTAGRPAETGIHELQPPRTGRYRQTPLADHQVDAKERVQRDARGNPRDDASGPAGLGGTGTGFMAQRRHRAGGIPAGLFRGTDSLRRRYRGDVRAEPPERAIAGRRRYPLTGIGQATSNGISPGHEQVREPSVHGRDSRRSTPHGSRLT